jgi:hypothetical protein
MATYTVEKLWQLWKQDQVTAEQAVGYLLQNVLVLEQQIQALEKRVKVLEQAAQGKVV